MNDSPDDILDRYARHEQARPISVPAGFADRVCNAVKVDQRRMTRRRWLVRGTGIAIAASVMIAVGVMTLGQPKPVIVKVTPTEPSKPTQKIGEEFSKASDALVSLTRQTTDQTIKPTQTLIATAEAVPAPRVLSMDTPALPDVLNLALDSFEPVASQPKKAVNLFMRDFGIAPRK
jgi:hypothetical protein